jgi:hypothetical protein
MTKEEPRTKRSSRAMIVHRTRPVIYRTCRKAADVRDALEFFTAATVDAIAVPLDWVWTGAKWTPPDWKK